VNTTEYSKSPSGSIWGNNPGTVVSLAGQNGLKMSGAKLRINAPAYKYVVGHNCYGCVRIYSGQGPHKARP
jgi:hypothetical protein